MPSKSVRNNNPGNLRASEWIQARPGYATSDAQGFAVFDSWWSGLKAMGDLLHLPKYQAMDVRGMISRYAPASENDTARYITRVCMRAGCKPEDGLARMTPAQFMAMLEAMVVHEGWLP